MVTVGDALAAINLGEVVAEHEEHLAEYFVETPDFRAICQDRHDLILGVKGSGKSAIARVLVTPDFEISELDDVDVIPAFNVGGSPFFSQLPDGLDESGYRRLWLAFFLSLAGVHLVDRYDSLSDVKQLSKALSEAGLINANGSTSSVWRRLVGALRNITPEASIEISENGTPVLTGRILGSAQETSTPESTPAWFDPSFDAVELVEMITHILEVSGRRCWSILDRLDESFADRPGAETLALRGLLRALLDVSGPSSRLRVKAFLRFDIFERITRDSGFVNLDHFRDLRLVWSRKGITDVLGRRLCASEDLVRLCATSDQDSLLSSVLPRYVHYFTGGRVTRMTTIPWCIDQSSSVPGEPSPRNALQLVRLAVRHASGDPSYRVRTFDSTQALVRVEDLMKGWEHLSKERLENHLFAEHNELRHVVESFRGGNERFDLDFLKSMRVPTGYLSESQIRELVRSGFLVVNSNRTYSVARLYCPALKLNAGTSRELGDETDGAEGCWNAVGPASHAAARTGISTGARVVDRPTPNFAQDWMPWWGRSIMQTLPPLLCELWKPYGISTRHFGEGFSLQDCSRSRRT